MCGGETLLNRLWGGVALYSAPAYGLDLKGTTDTSRIQGRLNVVWSFGETERFIPCALTNPFPSPPLAEPACGKWSSAGLFTFGRAGISQHH